MNRPPLERKYLSGIPEFVISIVEKVHNSNERHFHTCEHLNSILKLINEDFPGCETFDESSKRILTYATLFHDIIYQPWFERKNDHGIKIHDENVSAAYFMAAWEDESEMGEDMRKQLSQEEAEHVMKIIVQTQDRSGEDKLSIIFNIFDTKILMSKDMGELISYEHKIFKEYSFSRLDLYIQRRCEFLSGFTVAHIGKNQEMLTKLVEYIRTRPYNIAFYPGSFDPFHKGHLDILEKAERIFDKVIVVKGYNPDKKDSFGNIYTVKELQKREVIEIHGNIINHMFSSAGYGSIYSKYNPVLIRGVRNSSDLLYEENYLKFCKEIHPELRTSIILCDHGYSHISSSALRGLSQMKDEKSENIYEKYVVK